MTDKTDHTQYRRDTAGFRMTRDVPVAREDETLHDVRAKLAKERKRYRSVHYIFVVDGNGVFVGIFSVGLLFSASMDAVSGDVCKRAPLVTLHPSAHQERAAYLALKHGVKTIPVVDRDMHFLGAITSDTILAILHKEMHEDTLKRAGIRHPDAVHSNVLLLSLFTSYRHRIPWLILGLLGGLFTAKVIHLFEATLSRNLVLAAFIPLIVYMSDAVRTQMEAYIIRDLAVDHSIPITRYVLRHSLVVSLIALSLSILLVASYGIINGDWFFGAVLSLSLFAAVLSSVFTGLIIPFAFSRFSLDPADASGPIATIVQDFLSIVIYFSIATMLL